MERPQVVQDREGNPLALFLGLSKLDGYGDSVSLLSLRVCRRCLIRLGVRFLTK